MPYADRAAIDRGALAGHGLELLWVDDPVDRFFLEIQGSGQIRLADGAVTRVGYADQNGRPYRAIGKDLIERGAVPREKMSMQAIRDWLEAHPAEAPAMMAQQPVLCLLHELPDLAHASGPLGAQGVPLTPAARWPSTASSCRWARRSGSTPRHPMPRATGRCGGWWWRRTPAAPSRPRTRRRVLGRRALGRASCRLHEEPGPAVHSAAPRADTHELRQSETAFRTPG